ADSVGPNAAEWSRRSSSRRSNAPQSSQQPHPVQAQLPLPPLLSQALVAFTVEFDNEAERTLPHRTTDHGPSGPADGDPKPWLGSMVMGGNCMRHVTAEPITVANLLSRARTGTNLDGMRRWGYLTI